jgi:hypothetical protein
MLEMPEIQHFQAWDASRWEEDGKAHKDQTWQTSVNVLRKWASIVRLGLMVWTNLLASRLDVVSQRAVMVLQDLNCFQTYSEVKRIVQ